MTRKPKRVLSIKQAFWYWIPSTHSWVICENDVDETIVCLCRTEAEAKRIAKFLQSKRKGVK